MIVTSEALERRKELVRVDTESITATVCPGIFIGGTERRTAQGRDTSWCRVIGDGAATPSPPARGPGGAV